MNYENFGRLPPAVLIESTDESIHDQVSTFIDSCLPFALVTQNDDIQGLRAIATGDSIEALEKTRASLGDIIEETNLIREQRLPMALLIFRADDPQMVGTSRTEKKELQAVKVAKRNQIEWLCTSGGIKILDVPKLAGKNMALEEPWIPLAISHLDKKSAMKNPIIRIAEELFNIAKERHNND